MKVFYSNPVIKVILYKIIVCKYKHLSYISLSLYCCIICFIIIFLLILTKKGICIEFVFCFPIQIIYCLNQIILYMDMMSLLAGVGSVPRTPRRARDGDA